MPARRPRFPSILCLLLRFACLSALGALSACGGGGASAAKSTYYCPMHVNVVDDHDSGCPICGMNLVARAPGSAAPAGEGPAKIREGRMAIQVQPERLQQIGLRTEEVRERSVTNQVRLAATAEWDESRRARIAPRVGGTLEEVLVSATGTRVERGQPLFRLYSPDARAAQIELLESIKLNDGRLQASARKKLELLGMGPGQIDALAAKGQAGDSFEFLSPFSGVVVSEMVENGMSFEAGETLYELAETDRLWVRALAREPDLQDLRVGMAGTLALSAFPGRDFAVTITYLGDAFDPATRAAPIRLEAANPDGLLRPGHWGEVELPARVATGLAAPASAFIDTGTRVLSFVDHGDGDLEPREVTVTLRGSSHWVIRDGLFPGERVVTRALFLVDAESQFQAALENLSAREPQEAAP